VGANGVSSDGSTPTPSRPTTLVAHVQPRVPDGLLSVDERLPEPPVDPGDNQIVLMPRDPAWLYAYWALSDEYRCAARDAGGEQLCLRLHDVTDLHRFDGGNAHATYEHRCHEGANSWYLPVPAVSRSYLVEVGYVGRDQWFPLARSNRVEVPGDRPSQSSDVRFVTVEFDTALPATRPTARPAAGEQLPGPHPPGTADAGPSSAALGQAPGSVQPVAGSVQHVPGSVQQVAGSVQHVPGSVQQVAGSVQHVAGSVQQVAGSVQHVPGSVQQVAGSLAYLSEFSADLPRHALRRVEDLPPPPPAVARAIPGPDAPRAPQPPRLIETSAELVIEGRAVPNATVEIAGQRIAVGADGSFALRVPLVEGLGDLAIDAREGSMVDHIHLWFGQLSDRR
jgi:hypothetical protein